MKKLTKKLLLSALAALTAGSATVATAFSISTKDSVSAGAATAAGFEMVDGASLGAGRNGIGMELAHGRQAALFHLC